MKKTFYPRHVGVAASAIWLMVCLSVPGSALGRVVDTFDDNTKTGWTDFTFVPNVGLPVEKEERFVFEIPPLGQALFTASQKKTETLTLQEGRTLELRADVVSAGEKDSFAIVAFIPTSTGPGTLAGYGLAKSKTDILITKGIGKYFYNENPATPVKNENITLVLTLSVSGGNVTIRARILDKDANNAVVWEKTVVDTAAADVLADGKDDPAAPYVTEGYYTLFCYADFDSRAPENPYRVVYDNAEVFITDRSVLDDFNDNTKSDWTDFTFVPGFGLPAERGGQFVFEQPAAGQAIFSASSKTSREFELKEGERLEFRVDLIQGGAKDSFAILSFIPKSGGGPGTLAGYGLAKSTTDFLLTKGIGKYFYNENPAEPVKQDNITLVLSMTVAGGKVTIVGQVLDKDRNNEVIFEQTVVDTVAADVMADGKDDPAAPYITTGLFTLYLYQDFDRNAPEAPYRAVFDNAVVFAPPAPLNTAPIISEVLPLEFGNFLPATTEISFRAADDKPIADDALSITLNGTVYTKANGLTLGGSGNSRTARLGGLAADKTYVAEFRVIDSEGLEARSSLYFDTFNASSYVIEVEDYNFEGGKFADAPVVIPEGSGPQADAYSLQSGLPGIDFSDTRTSPRAQDTLYRPSDPVRMQHTLDYARRKYVAAGGGDSMVYDFDVGDFAAGEWMNYTRTFPAGSYEIYLRQAVVNMSQGDSVLEEVTSDPSKPDQTTRVLGSFLGFRTGFKYRNFPLTDGAGLNKIVVRLEGRKTLRLRQVTADTGDSQRVQNYLLFLPVADSGPERATIGSIAPSPGGAVETTSPAIRVEVQNRATSVDVSTVALTLNGQAVTPSISNTAGGIVISYAFAALPASGSTNLARVSFKDNQGVEQKTEWAFVVTYASLNPAFRVAGPGLERGFKYRFVQAPPGSGLENSLARAEDQLVAASRIPKAAETNAIIQVVNLNEVPEQDRGNIPGDTVPIGLDGETNGSDDYAVEVAGYLDLPAGITRFGIVTDDGYKLTAGRSLSDLESPVLAFHNGGPANEVVEFVVPQAGLYPFRFVYYERGGAGYAEWATVDGASGERILVNDPASPRAVKGYASVAAAPPVQLESSATVNGPYTVDTTAAVNSGAKTITVKPDGAIRFYRARNVSGFKFTSVLASGNQVVLTYE